MNKEHEAWIASQLDLVDKQQAEIERLRETQRKFGTLQHQFMSDNERLSHMNKALLAVAQRYAPAEHAAFCACVYDPGVECDCGFRAAHATIEEALGANQPASASGEGEK